MIYLDQTPSTLSPIGTPVVVKPSTTAIPVIFSPYIPPIISGAYSWFKADSLVGYSNGQTVTKWINFGIGPNFITESITVSPLPSYQSYPFPYVQFSGNEVGSELTTFPNKVLSNFTLTMYFVMRSSGSGQVTSISYPPNIPSQEIWVYSLPPTFTGSTKYFAYGNPEQTQSPTQSYVVPVNQWEIYCHSKNSFDTTSLYVNSYNNVQNYAYGWFTDSTPYETSASYWYLSTNLSSSIAEIIVYNYENTEAERQTVFSYLKRKYHI